MKNIVVLFLFVNLLMHGQQELKLLPNITDQSNLLIGYNGRSTEGPSWENPSFLNYLRDSKAQVMRYPAGTQANYWDWRHGTFIEGSGKTSDYPFTITMLIKGVPIETKLIYVVNMARPTPATGVPLNTTNEILKSENTLRLKINDMLDALKTFDAEGKLPYAVELGNELYFDNEHAAIYAADPDLYIKHTKIISQALKEQYPQIKILLITT